MTGELTISLRPLYRSYRFGEVSSTIAPMPGEFLYPPAGLDAFEVVVRNLADDWHIADIEDGGRGILHHMPRVGSARPDSRLRIQARVSDKAGDPVSGADVHVLPESAVTEAALSAAMTKGSTDQRGGFESETLAPGKYRLVATRRELDLSLEER